MAMMAEEILGTDCSFTSSDRKVSFEKKATYETVSTTDEDSRHEFDGLSDNELRSTTPEGSTDEQDLYSDYEDETFESEEQPCGLRTPDPLDFMPVAHVAPAFSEREIADAMARKQVFPGAGAPCFMNMNAMPPMGTRPLPPGAVMVPVPVPMPKMVPMPNLPLPFPMAAPLPQQVAVPKGFKLVRIPDAMKEAAETKEAKPSEKYSEIADPAKTERKIFVGGLSPVTVEETLVEYFSKFGPVADAKVIREGEKSKGFAFVQFLDTTPPEVLEGVHFIDQRRCGVGLAFHRQK
jgi:hypothetical protein